MEAASDVKSEVATGVPTTEPADGTSMKGTSKQGMLRNALVLIIVVISAYLLHGRHAQAVCNL
uniref:Major sperm protein n=1 Tax=Parascaris univalens TaxID=6257 RepID=A0A915AA60_PARUN